MVLLEGWLFPSEGVTRPVFKNFSQTLKLFPHILNDNTKVLLNDGLIGHSALIDQFLLTKTISFLRTKIDFRIRKDKIACFKVKLIWTKGSNFFVFPPQV